MDDDHPARDDDGGEAGARPAAAGGAAAASVSAALARRVDEAIDAAGGSLPFDRYMELVLYAPGLGYYARSDRQFGLLPRSGSDFVTAPELSPLYGRALAAQVAQALAATGTDEVIEFGAGSGALAAQLLAELDRRGVRVARYSIVEVSGALAARQRERLAPWRERVRWPGALPDAIRGVVVGNEVLDAMPVKLLRWDGRRWFERCVARAAAPAQRVVAGAGRSDGDGETLPAQMPAARPRAGADARAGAAGAPPRWRWDDVPTDLRPPVDAPHEAHFVPGTVTELHPRAVAFVSTLAERLVQGAAFLVDYGFPAHEYYLPERSGGTLMCHRAHRVDTDPLADPGEKDITSHVDFTAVALAAQDAGCEVLGYTSQGRFLINCGLPALMLDADLAGRNAAHRLLAEHEMGELFKVVGFARGAAFDAVGFAAGDRTHTL